MYKLRGAILHHSGSVRNNPYASTKHHTAEDVNRWHKAYFGEYCKSSIGLYGGYTYYIDQFGKVTQYRREDEEGCHTKGFNKGYIGICLASNGDIERFTDAQIKSLKALWEDIIKRHPQLLGKLQGHRDYSWKSCPGKLVSDHWIKMIDASAMNNELEKAVIEQDKIAKLQKQLNAIRGLLASLSLQVKRLIKG